MEVTRRDNRGPMLDDELISLLADTRHKPLEYTKAAWQWGVGDLLKDPGPRAWQEDTLGEIGHRLQTTTTRFQPIRIAVASGHGVGKSALLGMLDNWAMSTFEDCMGLVTANTLDQLRTKTSPEIGKWFRSSITSDQFEVHSTSIRAKDPARGEKWRTDFVTWSINNTVAFQGLHNLRKRILLMQDEASGIDDKVMEVCEGALTDEETEIIWIMFGNPTRNSGYFREAFRRQRHLWITKNVDSRTVPGTNKEYLKQMVDTYGENSNRVKVRIRGMFPTTSGKQFITGDDVDAAFNKHLRPEMYNFAPKIIGVDPAWEGDDEFVIILRQGLMCKILGTYEKNDNDIVMAQLIARFEKEHEADAVMVDGGFGTGIVSAGRTMGRQWDLVWFSGKSPDEGMLNLRAYMWDQMRQWLKTGATIPPDDILYQDLVGPEIVPRLDGKVQLESKKDMKDRMVQSPNRADALALTFVRPVVKKLNNTFENDGPMERFTVEAEYRPFAD